MAQALKSLWQARGLRIFGGTILVVILLLLAVQPSSNLDLWMHLSVGRTFWELKSVPDTDLFCYPTLGKTYIYFEWLYQLGLYLSYQVLGVYGFDVIKYLLWGGTLFFVYLTLRELSPHRWVAVAVLLLMAFWMRSRIEPAPDSFGCLFFSIFLYIIILYREKKKNFLFLLPFLQVLWINIHLSAFLGPLLVGFEWLDRLFWRYIPLQTRTKWGITAENKALPLRPILVLLGALILASFITPYFYKTLTFIFFYSHNLKQIKSGILEWFPIYKFLEFWPFLISVVLMLWSMVIGRRHLGPFQLLCILSFTFLSFSSARFFAYFVLGALPFLSYGLATLSWPTGASIRSISKRSLIHAVLIISLVGVNMIWLWQIRGRPVFDLAFDESLIPRGAADFLKREALPGRIFNYQDFGGYLEWRLYPQVMPFIDARHVDLGLFTEQMRILQDPAMAEDLLTKYGVNYIVTKSCSGNGKLWPLIEHLYQSPQWILIFSDDRSLIFLRDLSFNQPWIKKYQLPKKRIYQEVIEEIHGAKAGGRKGGSWDRTLGYAYYKNGQYKEAKEVLAQWLKDNPRDEAAKSFLRDLSGVP